MQADSFSSDEEIPEGRLTPSIDKAIRRSIFNLSRPIDSDAEEAQDEEAAEDENIQDEGSHDCCK